jgi:hypothetical protein
VRCEGHYKLHTSVSRSRRSFLSYCHAVLRRTVKCNFIKPFLL